MVRVRTHPGASKIMHTLAYETMSLMHRILDAIKWMASTFRSRKNQCRQVGERRRGYQCLSASLAWGCDDDMPDRGIKCRHVERITPRS